VVDGDDNVSADEKLLSVYRNEGKYKSMSTLVQTQ
jgi:hypothetical protein